LGAYEAQLRSALAAIRVGPAGIWWRGQRRTMASAAARRLLEPDAAVRLLHTELQWTLYTDFYCTGGGDARKLCPDVPEAATQPFLEALARANHGQGSWDGGWAMSDGAGDSTVTRAGLKLVLGDVPWRPTRGGEEVELLLPNELPGVHPGFYLALGDLALPPEPVAQGVRVYWNVTATGAIRLVDAVTHLLNDEQIPFRLKVLADLACFRRCDCAVLYLDAADLERALPSLTAIHESLRRELLPGTPALTRRLAPGVGAAESPSSGESFGLHRCRLLGAAVLEAQSRAPRSGPRRFELTIEHLRRHGVEVERPYATGANRLLDTITLSATQRPSPGALRLADLTPGGPLATPHPLTTRHPPTPLHPRATPHEAASSDRQAFLDAAHDIGMSLADTAIWVDERCTWIGAEGPLDPRLPEGGPPPFAPLGGDLYSGTGGVALFMAELATATGNPKFATTAVGAAHHALSRADAGVMDSRGLYVGALGAALGAVYAGVRLGEGSLVEKARELVRVLIREPPASEREPDLVSGLAGEVVALLTVARLLSEVAPGERAITAADALLGNADSGEQGLSWRSRSAKGGPNLLGFSHGAAGVAYALLEAFAATGDPAYRAAALDAFAYERSWFDPIHRNWPALRGARPTITPEAARRLPAVSHWCHGAAGVALARIRAYELLGSGEQVDEARTALDTTASAIAAAADVRLENFSLCHGLAGDAWVLLEGSANLPDPDPRWSRMADRVAHAGLEVYRSPESWLCGTRTHGAPGLMLGIAGIGLFYLRQSDPAVPSILLMRPGPLAEQVCLGATQAISPNKCVPGHQASWVQRFNTGFQRAVTAPET
jgi:hypothetical protein